jgi:hypothetical protein
MGTPDQVEERNRKRSEHKPQAPRHAQTVDNKLRRERHGSDTSERLHELGLGTYEPAQQSNGPTVLVTAR